MKGFLAKLHSASPRSAAGDGSYGAAATPSSSATPRKPSREQEGCNGPYTADEYWVNGNTRLSGTRGTTLTTQSKDSSMASEAATAVSDAAGQQSRANAKRHGSCYRGGTHGRCDTCGLVKLSCRCQRCYSCHHSLMTPSSRCHCRRCWRVHCLDCSKRLRMTDFMGGQMFRTCDSCAVPKALVFITQLRYSCYEALGEGDRSDHAEVKASLIRLQAEVKARPFHWGLYALGCEMDAPRRCIDPSCAAPLSYAETCPKCKAPTVTMTMHETCHVGLLKMPKKGAKHAGASDSAVKKVEDMVRAKRDAIAAAFTTAEADSLFATALPSGMEGRLFSSLTGSTWASRKALLSLVACRIAGESLAMPSISLAMMGLPLYAKLLRAIEVTELFTVFACPGKVRFIAFNSGASRRPAVHQVLSARMVTRELWSGHLQEQQQALGKIVESREASGNEGLSTMVAAWSMREGLLGYLAEDNIMQRALELVLGMVKRGEDVVICGHGIGGAAASWLTTCLLLENTREVRNRLLCVTFGAPLIASRPLSNVLIEHGLAKNFHHFVNSSDMVPRVSYVDSLLSSGNTVGCASIVGHHGTVASVREVRESVVVWTASHEEPRGPTNMPQAVEATEGGGSSLSNIVRYVRHRSMAIDFRSRPKSKKGSSMQTTSPADAAIRVDATEDGDLFQSSREPFDNNIDCAGSESMDDAEAELYVNRRSAGSENCTSQLRDKQSMTPFGFYHFLWHPRGKYMCAQDPASAIALLTDRSGMRIQLRDHLMSAYTKGFMEYIYSASPVHRCPPPSKRSS
ncbi:hypothetical protein GH5_07768 [Leishmania sp. Ghana 2012 LV757]|uniref:hypothetical protein n=1 Tax=Leishmania sp. Ghana 2012 LV757 TaxID=2803181 RepID=UPI001B637BB8|nr:hypothetical protein GH5_07768 [Leishmania sp. Ghana 2012 LV757]